jgi:hypothetical protein
MQLAIQPDAALEVQWLVDPVVTTAIQQVVTVAVQQAVAAAMQQMIAVAAMQAITLVEKHCNTEAHT